MPCPECAADPSPLLLQAVDEFNSGRFFEAHETIEALWLPETGPLKPFYKGLIQVAAACVHIGRGNYRGCVRLFETGCGYLQPFGPGCLGLDVAALVADAERCRQKALDLGRPGFLSYPPDLRPRIRLTVTPG